MGTFKHPKDQVGTSLHEAAVTMGHAGGPKGGPARSASLSKTERSSIASKAAKTRWRSKKSANEPLHPQGPPGASMGGWGGRQPIVGPPRGHSPPPVNQVVSGPSGLERAPQTVQDLGRYLQAPRKRNPPALPDSQVGPEIDRAFGQATAAMGRGRGRPTS